MAYISAAVESTEVMWNNKTAVVTLWML